MINVGKPLSQFLSGTVKALVCYFSWGLLIITLVNFYVAYTIAVSQVTISLKLVIGILGIYSLVIAMCIINDYFDIEDDKVAHPERPMVSGAVDPQEGLIVFMLLVGIFVLTGLLLRIQLYIYIGLIYIVVFSLTSKYKHYSRLPVGISLITANPLALGVFLIMTALLSSSVKAYFLYYVTAMFFIELSGCLISEIHDLEGDKRTDVETIAIKWGPSANFWLVIGCLLIALLMLSRFYLLFAGNAIPYLVVFYLVLLSIAFVFGLYSYHRSGFKANIKLFFVAANTGLPLIIFLSIVLKQWI